MIKYKVMNGKPAMLAASGIDSKELVRSVSANCAVPEIEVMAILDEIANQVSMTLANGSAITIGDIVTLVPEFVPSGYRERPWNLSRINAKATRELQIASSEKVTFQKI